MKKILNEIKLSGIQNVLVVGDVMLDEYVFGSVSRISPEAPVPVLRETKREWSLGGAANVALNCKQIGCNVSLIGVIGNQDRAGRRFLSMLAGNGINTKGLIQSDNRVTTCKKRLMAANHQLLRIDSEDTHPLSDDEFLELDRKLQALLAPGVIVLVSDYAKGVLTKSVITKIVSYAKQHGCLVIVDPKGTDFTKYAGVNYLKPNHKEYGELIQSLGLNTQDSVVENSKRVCEKLSLDGLFVTMGEKGIQFVSANEEILVPACKKEVFDLTGAGDTVMAFLALGLTLKFPIKKCLRLANHAAGVAVSHVKTYAVSLEELLEQESDSNEKIFSDWALLKIELDWLRLENKKIVFTNGCFDLLHSGHIHVLMEAKRLGDILVVAINTDESVKRFKGKDRPIKMLSERAQVLASIGVVDFIVYFDQDTPKELIEYVKPDILVKGGDYQKEKVAGYDIVTESGGVVHIVDYKQGLSTSNLVKQVRSSSC